MGGHSSGDDAADGSVCGRLCCAHHRAVMLILPPHPPRLNSGTRSSENVATRATTQRRCRGRSACKLVHVGQNDDPANCKQRLVSQHSPDAKAHAGRDGTDSATIWALSRGRLLRPVSNVVLPRHPPDGYRGGQRTRWAAATAADEAGRVTGRGHDRLPRTQRTQLSREKTAVEQKYSYQLLFSQRRQQSTVVAGRRYRCHHGRRRRHGRLHRHGRPRLHRCLRHHRRRSQYAVGTATATALNAAAGQPRNSIGTEAD